MIGARLRAARLVWTQGNSRRRMYERGGGGTASPSTGRCPSHVWGHRPDRPGYPPLDDAGRRPSRRPATSPGGASSIETITKRIEAEGIKYIFFQQVSITGRVMGKGVVADFFPQVAERGYQLVYGATANLFTDRAGDYIGFGPEESELAAIADLDTFATLPWDPRVARVLCDCYDTETGDLLDADPRQNLKRVVAEFEKELGYSFLIGIEPEMMWLGAAWTAATRTGSPSPTATTSTSSRNCVRCCST